MKCETCKKRIRSGKNYIYDVANDLISCTQKCKDRFHEVIRK